MNEELVNRVRPLVGIAAGAIIGGAIYGVSRSWLPGGFAVGAVIPGTLAGLGARIFGAIGTRAQLRVLVFGALFATLIGEYAALAARYDGFTPDQFAPALLSEPIWLMFVLLFLVVGIFFGVRLLVGTDALADVIEHAGDALPFGSAGMPCPACEARRTVLDQRSLIMTCEACGHTWRRGEEGAQT